MKTKYFFLGKLATLSFILAFFINCSGENNSNKIKIGVVIPLTGKLAEMGEVEKNGMLLALKNDSTKNVELVFEDSKSNPKDGVTAAKKLLDVNKVNIIITSTTGTSMAVEPIATSKKTNHIAYCMDTEISKKSPYVVRFYEGVESEAVAINEYFSNSKNAKRVGLLFNRVEVWDKINKKTIMPHLNKLGVSTPFIEDFAVGEKDFKNIVAKLKSSNLDHIVLLGYGFEFPELFQELKQSNLLGKIKIIGGWGFLYSKVPSSDLEGVLVAGPEYVFSGEKNAISFYENYKNTFGTEPNFDAAMAYNVIQKLSSFKLDELNTPIKSKLVNKSFEGVIGGYSFDNHGNMVLKTTIGTYHDGKIQTK